MGKVIEECKEKTKLVTIVTAGLITQQGTRGIQENFRKDLGFVLTSFLCV